jgi:hypothetical protein
LQASGQRLLPQKVNDVPATIAFADSLAYPDADAIIIRRPGSGANANIIVLPQGNATAALLSSCAFMFEQNRRISPGQPASERVFRVLLANLPQQVKNRSLPQARRILREAERATAREIEGVGLARAVTVWFPANDRDHGRY